MMEYSENIILRVWEEIFTLFVDYLFKSPLSTFKKIDKIFARK